MPYRSPTLESNEFYHIFNRSIAHEKIFSTIKLKNVFLNMMYYYNANSLLPYSFLRFKSNKTIELQENIFRKDKPGIEIVAFAVMPTHFHLILKQTQDGDVSRYMRRLEISYAKYYNQLKQRHGGVFSGRFGSVKIRSQHHLHVVSRYIYLNPIKAKLTTIDKLSKYPFTSYYLLESENKMVHSKYILHGFDSAFEYSLFVKLGFHDNLQYLPEEF